MTVGEGQTHLADPIDEATESAVVTVSGDLAAKVTPAQPPGQRVRRSGSAAGRVHVAPDFDEPLADFADYT
jgi:antitoxin (DNA-binding transcriptional repressor) of toxin-antitoxin stability system